MSGVHHLSHAFRGVAKIEYVKFARWGVVITELDGGRIEAQVRWRNSLLPYFVKKGLNGSQNRLQNGLQGKRSS